MSYLMAGAAVFKMGDVMVATARMIPEQAPADMPAHWMTYFLVEDVEQAAAKSDELGGTTLIPKMVIPNMGEFVTLQDPTGGVFSAWKDYNNS